MISTKLFKKKNLDNFGFSDDFLDTTQKVCERKNRLIWTLLKF